MGILWELFVIFNRFMQDLSIDYWVSYGTLLGFHRNRDLIAHDIDIDISCDEQYYELILENRDRLPPEVGLYDTTFRHYGPKLYLNYKGFDGDIYFFREKEDRLLSLENIKWENYRVPIPKNLIYPTQPFEIRGIETSIPHDVEGYLTHVYGNLSPDATQNSETGYWE